jgi:ABC-type glycerol-3-phosphate transport system substrate-binding protein
MNKKRFALIWLIGLCLIIGVACSPSTPAPATEVPIVPTEIPVSESVTIRALIRPDEGENVAIFAKKFEELTGHNVEVDFVGWAEIYNKIVTTLATGGGGYDIIFVPSANALEFMSMGLGQKFGHFCQEPSFQRYSIQP